MARFIHLTSANPGLLGKVRINIDRMPVYYPQGTQTVVNMGAPGFIELVKESCAEIDELVRLAGGAVTSGKILN